MAVSDGKLIRRSTVTIGFGVLAVIGTAALISLGLGISHLQSKITSRTSPNLIDLGIAIAVAVAGLFSMTRKQLSNSIAGVAIAVALVLPLCVSGIRLTLGSKMVAVFGSGTVAGLTNQIVEGSFLLLLANLIAITVTSLVVFLVQRYGSFRSCWRNFLVWLGLLRLLSLPLLSALHDFSLRQEMDAEFGRFKPRQLKHVAIAQGNQRLWSKVRLMYSSVSVVDNKARLRLDVVLNAPEDIVDQSFMNKVNHQMLKRAKGFGSDDLDVNISVIPNRVYKFDNQKINKSWICVLNHSQSWFYVASKELIRPFDNVQSFVALSLSFASSEGSVVLN
ncbi:DUF389 domain-containing protein [Parasynechococcus sp.]|uniref:DUF389 domain-containing protein n=1 Tax=Parasynechococcus sp. TaxID=3101203 RepID=UPI0037038818